MERYVTKKFSTFVKEKVLDETIFGDNPVPKIDALSTPEIDEYLDDIGDSR